MRSEGGDRVSLHFAQSLGALFVLSGFVEDGLQSLGDRGSTQRRSTDRLLLEDDHQPDSDSLALRGVGLPGREAGHDIAKLFFESLKAGLFGFSIRAKIPSALALISGRLRAQKRVAREGDQSGE